jgi:hypothetical protein
MGEVEDYILSLENENQIKLMTYFHQLMLALPTITSKIRFKIPFYYSKSWVCYLNPLKNGFVEFAFLRGNELSNEQGILKARGRQQVAGIIFEEIDEHNISILKEIIQEALLLDQSVAYPPKHKG